MTGGSKVVGYIRVSTAEQGNSGLGLEAQRAAIRAEGERRGWIEVAMLEDVCSGKTVSNRPSLAEALRMVSAHEADGIVVAKLDRLSRSLLDFAGLVAKASAEGWNLVALDLGIDLSTPAGEAMANVMATFAQLERRLIGARIREALAVKKARGERVGRESNLTPALERRIQRLRAKGHSLQAICDRFNKQGVPTLRGGMTWRPSTLHRIMVRRERG
jgi:DNA invertase Pin-like site-specific DNA recombinase